MVIYLTIYFTFRYVWKMWLRHIGVMRNTGAYLLRYRLIQRLHSFNTTCEEKLVNNKVAKFIIEKTKRVQEAWFSWQAPPGGSTM